jgi:hypothetical protein
MPSLPFSAEPSELIWRGWRDDRRIAAFPIAQGEAYRNRFGAPFIGIHRGDLQRVLGAAHGPDRLHLGHRLVALSEKDNVVKLEFAGGSSAEVDVLVGADGQRSIVRRYVAGEERAAYSGAASAELFLSTISRRYRTRMRCNSGWGRMHISYTMRSARWDWTSIFSPSLKGQDPGRTRIGSHRSRMTRPSRLSRAGIRPLSK